MPYGLKLFPSVLLPPSFRLELGFLCTWNFDDDDDQLLSVSFLLIKLLRVSIEVEQRLHLKRREHPW